MLQWFKDLWDFLTGLLYLTMLVTLLTAIFFDFGGEVFGYSIIIVFVNWVFRSRVYGLKDA